VRLEKSKRKLLGWVVVGWLIWIAILMMENRR
jgi:hypothetical protein